MTDDDKRAAAETRKAKGSVHEAIGKLMGDDDACRHGAAEQRAGQDDADRAASPPRKPPAHD